MSFNIETIEDGDTNLLQRILDGEYDLIQTIKNYNWKRIHDIEYRIIIDIVNNQRPRDWDEWLIKNTDCKILNFVTAYYEEKSNFYSQTIANPSYLDLEINNFDSFLSKDFELISYLTFTTIIHNITNMKDFTNFIKTYLFIKEKHSDFHWVLLLNKRFESYLKFSEIYSFNPFVSIDLRKQDDLIDRFSSHIEYGLEKNKTDQEEDFKTEAKLITIYAVLIIKKTYDSCTIDYAVSMNELLKKHFRIITKKNLREKLIICVGAGLINNVIDSFEDEIKDIMKENYDLLIMESVKFNNTKLIDYLYLKFPDYHEIINYYIVCYGIKEIVLMYLPDLNQNKIDDLINKLIVGKNNCR